MGKMWLIVIAIVVGVVLLLVAGVAGMRAYLVARRRRELELARKTFHQQRERLEAKFVQLASESGSPRGLRWANCDFSDDVTFARERDGGALSAFVAVTISFEAIEGGGMEDVEAVGNLRAATSVFHFQGGRWSTKGRTIMNLEPAEAIERFHQVLEPE